MLFFYVKNVCMFRINADNNDIPWPFTVDSYPSLVYFPALDKAESISFPVHLELTLPNLVQFVRRAAGPTADIGVCSQMCIRTNLHMTAVALCKLHSERYRSLLAIYHLQSELGALFAEPSSDPDSVILNSITDEASGLVSPFTASNNEREDVNLVDTDTLEAVSHTTAPADMEPMRAVDDFVASKVCGAEGELCNNNVHLDVDQSVSTASKDSPHDSRTSCSVERVLRLRDELATLRRHLHRVEVKQSLLRHLYANVLLPAVIHGSRQLERRRWLAVRQCKIIAGLRLRNYRDYFSGWDVGS